MAGLLGGGEYNRQSKCHRTRYVAPGESVGLLRSESGTWSLRGVVKCGHATCPACGPRMCRSTAAQIGAAMSRHLGDGARLHFDGADLDAAAASAPRAGSDRGHDVWMLTATIPHYDEGAPIVVARLYRAWKSFLRSRGWRRFQARWGIVAVVRVLDATHNGRPHPHFHVALFPTRSWMPYSYAASWDGLPSTIPSGPALGGVFSRSDRARYLAELAGGLHPAWEAAVIDAGVVPRDLPAFRAHGLKLQPCEDAGAYFVKWGLAEETGATSYKHDNHLSLLDACGAGDDAAGAAYVTWRAAVDGRQWVTGLADARTATGTTDIDVDVYAAEQRRKREVVAAAEGHPLVKVAPLALQVPATLYAAALAVGWRVVVEAVERGEAAGEDPQNTLIAALVSAVGRPRGPPS